VLWIGCQPEPLCRAVDHHPGCSERRLSNRSAHLGIHDDGMTRVDQVIAGIGEDRAPSVDMGISCA
jgi:hypothetical protein